MIFTFAEQIEEFILDTYRVCSCKVSSNDAIDYIIEDNKKQYNVTAFSDTKSVRVTKVNGTDKHAKMIEEDIKAHMKM